MLGRGSPQKSATTEPSIIRKGYGDVEAAFTGGNKVVESGRHRLRQTTRETFNAAMRRLVA